VSPNRYENINKQAQKAAADLKSFVEMLWEKCSGYTWVKHPRSVALRETAVLADDCIVIFDVVSEGVGVKVRVDELKTRYNGGALRSCHGLTQY
jgi:hypothetical protein